MSSSEVRTLLPDLAVLLEFAGTGSVTVAAERLRMPQPSASRALARLSERCGVALTRRAGRRLELTEAGEHLAAAASQAFDTLEDGLVMARGRRPAARCSIAVSYQALLGERYLPRAVARFTAREPQVGLSLTHGARTESIAAVSAGEADVAVVADPAPTPGLTTTVLFSEPLFAVVPAAHALAQLQRAVRAEEIRRYDLIALRSGFGLHESTRKILMPERTTLASAIEVDDYRIARGLAAAGLGVTILPPSTSQAGDEVVEIPIDHPEARRTIGVLTREGPDETVSSFIQALRTTAQYQWPASSLAVPGAGA
jgi:LysR family transcriptional activator of glutamate synthase operon